MKKLASHIYSTTLKNVGTKKINKDEQITTISHFTPSEQITFSLFHYFTPLAAQLLHNFTPSLQITPSLLYQFGPLESPNLTLFWPPYSKTASLEPTTSVSSTGSPLPPDNQCLSNFWRSIYKSIYKYSYMVILVRGNSSKVLPLQPFEAHSYMAFLVRAGGGGNSSKVLLLQPIAAHSYMAIFVRGGGDLSKVLPLQPNRTWQL